MKKSIVFLILIAFTSHSILSCKKSDDKNNNKTIPDATFNLNVSGAESHSINFALQGNTATDNAINGTYLSGQQQLSVIAMSLPVTWMYGLVADVNSLKKGTYNLKPGQSSFTPPSQTTGYMVVSGTVEITEATLYQDVSSVEDWFIDGTFSGTYQDNSNPPNQITASGSFSGINIKAQ